MGIAPLGQARKKKEMSRPHGLRSVFGNCEKNCERTGEKRKHDEASCEKKIRRGRKGVRDVSANQGVTTVVMKAQEEG